MKVFPNPLAPPGKSPANPERTEIERVDMRLEPGAYAARIGFREFGTFESEWFSAASDDVNVREKPFELDIGNSDVQAFSDSLFSQVDASIEDPDFVESLDAAYARLLPSAPVAMEESFDRLSDIVRAGTGTCAAKTTLLGVLLSRKFPELEIQEIYGQVGLVKERVSYPYSHVWLRIESGSRIFLYDPMYSRSAVFEKTEQGIVAGEGYKIFQNYSVEAQPISALYRQARFSRMSGVIQVVEEHSGNTHRFFLQPEAGFAAQADGAIDFDFELAEPATLALFDNRIQSQHKQGAALYYPIRELERIPE